MHNTSTKYSQMHNKTIPCKDNWILIFYSFRGRLLLDPSTSSSSSFMTSSFLIQMLRWIRGSSYSSSLEVSSLDGESLIFSCSHLLFSYSKSSFFFLCMLFPESVESNHFLLAHIPRMNESHDLVRPFKVVITISTFSTSSSITSSCSLIWETLVKYGCMVSAFWIFTFFN